MAIVKMEKDMYGQIELNHVAWRRTGRIEAQCKLDPVEFAEEKAENGMLLSVDKVNRRITKATQANAVIYPVGINYSTEHIYDERTPGLKHFALGKDDFLPRIGYPEVGDTFTTNTANYDTTEFADQNALENALDNIKNVSLYAAATTGYWQITATAPASLVGPVARVVEKTTMPDGQLAVKLQILKVV